MVDVGSARSRRMPGVSVRNTSFSAFIWAATAAAAVSAFTFNQPPRRVHRQRRNHRRHVGVGESGDQVDVHPRHLTDTASQTVRLSAPARTAFRR